MSSFHIKNYPKILAAIERVQHGRMCDTLFLHTDVMEQRDGLIIINDDRLPVWQVDAVYSLIIIRTASVSKVGWTWKENGREQGEGCYGVCTVVMHTGTECHVSDLCIKSSLRLTTDMAHVESKLHRSTSKDSSIIDHCRVFSLPLFSSPPPSATDWQWHFSLSPRAALMIAHKHARGGPHAWVCLSVCLSATHRSSVNLSLSCNSSRVSQLLAPWPFSCSHPGVLCS